MAGPNKIYTFVAGRFSLPQFQMLGFILFILAAYLLYQMKWFGLVALIVGFALSFAVIGIQIDFEKNLHREFISLLGVKLGKWKSLPKIEYVTIFNENFSQRGSVASIDANFKDSKLRVSLIVSKTEKYDGGFFNDKEKALFVGKMCARKLDTKLLDYTSREPVWVDVDKV